MNEQETEVAFGRIDIFIVFHRMLLSIKFVLACSFDNNIQCESYVYVVRCGFCARNDHDTNRHRCRYCTRRGDHRGSECPYRHDGCLLCGNKQHATGEHRCSVCSQYGHRGRECHTQEDVGAVELLAFFRFHHFLYYNTNLKKSVEFTD